MKKIKLPVVIVMVCFSALISIQLYAQTYCIPPESTYGGPLTGFTNVSIGTLNNNSSSDGYTDYTTTVNAVTLSAGSSYTPSFILYDQVIGSGFTDKLNLRIWIDFNVDGDFEDAGEMVYSGVSTQLTSSSGNNFTGTPISIPSNATSCTTRMRVYCDMLEADGHDTPNPCGYLNSSNPLGQHGECEDYKVVISGSSGIQNDVIVQDFNVFMTGNSLNVQYDLSNSANVLIDLYDVYGQKVCTLDNSYNSTGQYSKVFNMVKISRGIYILRLKVNDDVITRKITL